jgi:DNA-binding beta-propeller fold protein YncE
MKARTLHQGLLKSTLSLMLVLASISLLSGCAAKHSLATGPVFFPPAPDPPHVQFLTGVSSSADLSEEQSSLSRVLTGGKQTILRIGKPYGVATHAGKVYVCDIGAAQVVVIDFAKKTMKNLYTQRGPGELKKPIGVAVDDDGNVYVADNGKKDIQVYDSEGKFLKTMGAGLEAENFIAVAVYKESVLLLDNRKGLIYVLDRKSGDLVSKIGDNADRTQNLSFPNGLTVDSKGNIFAVNIGNGKVKKYDLDGHLLSEFGKLGDAPAEFTRPRGVAVDDQGLIFVVDAGHGIAQVFNEEHHILGFFGQAGLLAGSLNLPAGIAVSKDNLELFQKMAAPGFKLSEVIFVSNQYATPINHSLAVYGLGEMEGAKPIPRSKNAPPLTAPANPAPAGSAQ